MPELDYEVREYDAQREGMALVSGWKVWAQVIVPTGRKFAPVAVAICESKDDADEIAALLNAKYGAVNA